MYKLYIFKVISIIIFPNVIYRLNESHLTSHTSDPLKKIVKILETRPQSSKNGQKMMKNLKKGHWCLVCNSFFVFLCDNIFFFKFVGEQVFRKKVFLVKKVFSLKHLLVILVTFVPIVTTVTTVL